MASLFGWSRTTAASVDHGDSSSRGDANCRAEDERRAEKLQLVDQQRRVSERDLAYLSAVVQERDEAIDTIVHDVAEVHQMFEDLRNVLAEQSPIIDTVEEHITHTVYETKRGVDHLRKAQEHQQSSTCLLC